MAPGSACFSRLLTLATLIFLASLGTAQAEADGSAAERKAGAQPQAVLKASCPLNRFACSAASSPDNWSQEKEQWPGVNYFLYSYSSHSSCHSFAFSFVAIALLQGASRARSTDRQLLLGGLIGNPDPSPSPSPRPSPSSPQPPHSLQKASNESGTHFDYCDHGCQNCASCASADGHGSNNDT
eukprot:scaffold6184_cov18-Tisochrysis_lutea.AAC.1